MSKRRIPFSEQIRRAVEATEAPRYRIAKAAGVSESTFSRFMSGHSGLSLAALDKLADALGLEVVQSGPVRVELGRPTTGRKPVRR